MTDLNSRQWSLSSFNNMSKRIPIFVVVAALVALMPLQTQAEINLERLFWPEHQQQNITGLVLIASFEDAKYSSYLFNKLDDESLLLIEPGKEFSFNGQELRLSKVTAEQLVLSSKDGGEYILKLVGVDTPPDALTRNTEAKAKVQNQTKRQLTATGDELLKAKNVARALGLPNVLIENFNIHPVASRSRGGRNGWLLSEDFPLMFFQLTPFKKNDLVLSVDGIPAHHVETLLEHINKKGKLGTFDVEIQRNTKLKLIKVYMK